MAHDSEVDAHHDPPPGRVAYLLEPGGDEDAATADVELTPGDLLPRLGDHRVALEGTSAAFTRELDGRERERTADTAAPKTRARHEAGHGPDAGVGLVLGSAQATRVLSSRRG